MVLTDVKNLFDNNVKKITLDDISNIENKYHFKFPREVKDFYLSYNGGMLKKKYFFLDGDSEPYDINEIISIKYEKANLEDCLYNVDFNTEQSIYPTFLVPFARDRGGCHYLFSLREIDIGAVYFINYEYLDDADCIVPISKSFNGFLMLLLKSLSRIE